MGLTSKVEAERGELAHVLPWREDYERRRAEESKGKRGEREVIQSFKARNSKGI
jgi:hypothetical protein